MNKEEMREAAAAAAELLQPVVLRAEGYYDAQSHRGINKAGIAPFMRDAQGNLRFYLMKPRASEKYNAPSKLQICKGTREFSTQVQGQEDWHNYTAKSARKGNIEQLEPLLITALREGIEEIGLRMSNLHKVYEWGKTEFRSESTGQPRTLWLYFAEIKDKDAFDQPNEEHANTGERLWVEAVADQALIREDYCKILQKAEKILAQKD